MSISSYYADIYSFPFHNAAGGPFKLHSIFPRYCSVNFVSLNECCGDRSISCQKCVDFIGQGLLAAEMVVELSGRGIGCFAASKALEKSR